MNHLQSFLKKRKILYSIFFVFILINFFYNNYLYSDETFGVPIPVIGTSPNTGTTIGFLLAVVSERQGRLTSILAPVFTKNDLTGYNLDINYFGFPSENISYWLYLSHSTENFWDYSIEYHHKNFLLDNLRLDGVIDFTHEAALRFYGIGPKTEEDDETSYTMRGIFVDLTLTFEIKENIFTAFSLKGRREWIRKGVVDDVPSIEEKFPNIEGLDKGYSVPIQLAFIIDSRDDEVSPTSGIYAKFFVEVANKSVLSTSSFQRYGAEAKIYFALDKEKRFITALRGMIYYLDGDDIPFYEMSTLGGENTLRGFGEGRFYDYHCILCNVEERIRVFRFLARDILLDIEASLFLDIGQVFDSFSDINKDNIQTVFGAGIRFVVRSQIVAKIDIGYGDEGKAVFAGLDYPF